MAKDYTSLAKKIVENVGGENKCNLTCTLCNKIKI